MDTVISTLGGGILGAAVKILAGLLTLWLENRRDERHERITLIGKQTELLQHRPDPGSPTVSFTRRILAWGVCFTFCFICALWAIYPSELIHIPAGQTGGGINLFLFNFLRETTVVKTVSTGWIVWSLLPFISMIMMTYFTPDVSKIR